MAKPSSASTRPSGTSRTGIEKTTEQKKYQQVIPLVDGMDYLSAQSNSLSSALTAENVVGIEVPDRVKWIRVLLWNSSGSTATWCASGPTPWRLVPSR